MRRLILMRHAQADDSYVGEDEKKPLTEEGQKVQSQMGNYFKEQNILIDAVFCSPLLRTKQSAEIFLESFPKAKIQIEVALGPAFDPSTLLKKVIKSPFKNVLFVGHEPSLALLASHLMKNYVPFKFEKSGALILEFEEHLSYGEGNFKGYLSPKECTQK